MKPEVQLLVFSVVVFLCSILVLIYAALIGRPAFRVREKLKSNVWLGRAYTALNLLSLLLVVLAVFFAMKGS
jgi:hypothetical protein